MEDNIFKFEDFLDTKSSKLEDIKKLLEDIQNDNFDIEEAIQEDSFINESILMEEEPVTEIETVIDEVPAIVEEEVEEIVEPETENYYNLYSDKSENFICDIAIQGANLNQTEARLVIESEDWTLMFYGELKGGKCLIPIKKLNILKEGQIGDIRLEVIAEGNLFIPWEDKFKVKVSKKVTVKVNEQKGGYRNSNVGIKVNVKK